MRKSFSIILFFVIFLISFSHAEETNLQDLSFEEIQCELDTYNLKIWQSGNWSSVIVPNGTYIIGKDIPSGKYTVRSCTSKMATDLELKPVGCDPDEYYHDPRYLDLYLKNSDKEIIELVNGDSITISYAGTQFILPDYMPRFNQDSEQDAEVQRLLNEHDLLLSELKSRPEWREIIVPEGLYEVGTKIPAGQWTIWPKDNRAGVYYGKDLDTNGKIFYTPVRAGLKKHNLPSFEFGFHEGWVSINAQEGWYIQIDNSVIFTPYIGTTLFQFNE